MTKNKVEEKNETDNVVEISKNENELKQPYLDEKELMQFKLFDAELTKNIMFVSNMTLQIQLEEANHQLKMNNLSKVRDEHIKEQNKNKETYENFMKQMTQKYGIESHFKVSVDPVTGLLRSLA